MSYFGEVFMVAKIRCCVRCWGPFGLAQLLGGRRRSRGDRPTVAAGRGRPALPMIRGFALALGGGGATALPAPPRWRLSIRSQKVATLPWFRAGGGSVFAAQSRHEEPYPPMSKINPTFPFILPLTGNVGKYTPFPRRFQAGNAVFGNCAGGAGVDARQETRTETSRR